MIRKAKLWLAWTIGLAFVTRLIVLVMTRPDFVGWFNHSPYYWIQTRSLLENGALAYSDMPLLFAVYATFAKLLGAFGLPTDTSIVLGSRVIMVALPSLVPLAVYRLALSTPRDGEATWPIGLLILASGFLPMSFATMPEHLQKNMLGVFLLAVLFPLLARWYRSKNLKRVLTMGLLATAVCLAHMGSALALLLLLATVFADLALTSSLKLRRLLAGFSMVFLPVAVALLLAIVNPASVDRVLHLVRELRPSSPGEGLVSLLALILWTGILALAWRWLRRHSSGDEDATGFVARVSFLWIGTLVMPLWPGDIGMRLLLFLPLGMLVFLVTSLAIFENSRIPRGAAALVAIVFTAMGAAEATSTILIYPNKAAVQLELNAVRQKYDLSDSNLVITPYGVNPIANWYLGTSASLVTSVESNVWQKYSRVFVLNTMERRAPYLEPGECRLASSDYARYWVTRHDVPLDPGFVRDTDFVTFEWYRLESTPDNWHFDKQGQWSGWGRCQTAER